MHVQWVIFERTICSASIMQNHKTRSRENFIQCCIDSFVLDQFGALNDDVFFQLLDNLIEFRNVDL